MINGIPLLHIVVPTRDRESQVKRQLSDLVRLKSAFSTIQIEISVSDNGIKSKLDSEAIRDICPNINYVRPPLSFETVEEHFAWIVREFEGKYLWILGDDDILIDSGFQILIENLKTEIYDILWFENHDFRDFDGANWLQSFPIGNQISNVIKFKFLPLYRGFWFSSAISSIIFRKSKYLTEFHLDLIKKKQIIFSHVTALIASFGNSDAYISNFRLTKHRLTGTSLLSDMSGWKKLAGINQTVLHSPWTNNWILQLSELIKIGALEWDEVKFAFDRDQRNSWYHLDEVHQHIVEQCKIDNFENAGFYTNEELFEMMTILSALRPDLRDLQIEILNYANARNRNRKERAASFTTLERMAKSLLHASIQSHALQVSFGHKLIGTPKGYLMCCEYNIDFLSNYLLGFEETTLGGYSLYNSIADLQSITPSCKCLMSYEENTFHEKLVASHMSFGKSINFNSLEAENLRRLHVFLQKIWHLLPRRLRLLFLKISN